MVQWCLYKKWEGTDFDVGPGQKNLVTRQYHNLQCHLFDDMCSIVGLQGDRALCFRMHPIMVDNKFRHILLTLNVECDGGYQRN